MSSAGAARFVLEPSDGWPTPDGDEDPGRVTVPSLRERLAAAMQQGLTEAHAVLQARPGPVHAPGVDEPVWAYSPSILWPDDHAWVFATGIDFDSTLVAGTTALVRELVRTPGVEVLPIRTDADLTWDGDAPHRPK